MAILHRIKFLASKIPKSPDGIKEVENQVFLRGMFKKGWHVKYPGTKQEDCSLKLQRDIPKFH